MHLADWMSRIDLGEEIQEVYVHSFLYNLATSLVAVFIPLYILDLGFPVTYVFTFYVFYFGMQILLAVPFSALASRIGYKHLSLLSSVPILGFYFLIRTVETGTGLHFVGVLGGVGFTAYWMGMNPEVATSTHDEKEDEESGFFISMPNLASVISPFIGGLILLVFNFNMLFSATAGLIALSFLPFLFSREHTDGMDINFSQLVSREYLDDFLTYFFEGGQSIGHHVAWPLLIALVIGGSLNIGGAGSLLALGGAVSSIFVGKISEKYGRNKVLWYGASSLAVVLFTMAFTGSAYVAFLVSLMHGVTHSFLSVPLYSSAIDRSEGSDLLEYFAFREISLSLGRVTFLGLFAALFFFVPDYRFIAVFTAASLGAVSCSFFARRMNRP